MKYVFDASVGLKTVLPEAGSDKAEAPIGTFHELIAPDTFQLSAGPFLLSGQAKIKLTLPLSVRLRQDEQIMSRRQLCQQCRHFFVSTVDFVELPHSKQLATGEFHKEELRRAMGSASEFDAN